MKNLKNLGQVLNKTELKSIAGGEDLTRPCAGEPTGDPCCYYIYVHNGVNWVKEKVCTGGGGN
jgi:hypothetical protein